MFAKRAHVRKKSMCSQKEHMFIKRAHIHKKSTCSQKEHMFTKEHMFIHTILNTVQHQFKKSAETFIYILEVKTKY